jgi:hypothetical protein
MLLVGLDLFLLDSNYILKDLIEPISLRSFMLHLLLGQMVIR